MLIEVTAAATAGISSVTTAINAHGQIHHLIKQKQRVERFLLAEISAKKYMTSSHNHKNVCTLSSHIKKKAHLTVSHTSHFSMWYADLINRTGRTKTEGRPYRPKQLKLSCKHKHRYTRKNNAPQSKIHAQKEARNKAIRKKERCIGSNLIFKTTEVQQTGTVKLSIT